MSKVPVILYHYDASPFATKIKNILTLKGIPHKRVAVTPILPRPELSEYLNIAYRRIPILAIGKDVYCDSSLIASVLERRFPPSEGYGTLFPKRVGGGKTDTGLIKALAMFWSDRTIFPLAANSLPYDKFDKKFIKDRESWMGTSFDIQEMLASQPELKSTFASHMALIEEQLSDSRQWLMDTETPSLIDISVHFILAWISRFKNMSDLLDGKTFPQTTAFVKRMSEYLDRLSANKSGSFENITGKEAAELIASSSSLPPEVFDDVESARLKVALGELASVTPTDNGKIPVTGRLVALTREEAVVETKGSIASVLCHFPRLNFVVKPQSNTTPKL